VLLPAVLLHGLFDFTLFIAGLIEFVYRIDSSTHDAVTLVVAGCITYFGLFYAFVSYKAVRAKERKQVQVHPLP